MNTIGDGFRAIGKVFKDLGDMVDDPKVQKGTIDTMNSIAVSSKEMNEAIVKCTSKCDTMAEFKICMDKYIYEKK